MYKKFTMILFEIIEMHLTRIGVVNEKEDGIFLP